MNRIAFALLACQVASACTTPSGERISSSDRDANLPPRRWLKPPPGEVHAYPPHAIRADGIGPYLLSQTLSDVLHSLPEGPRVELLQIGSVANWRVVRAEGGQLLLLADAQNQVAAAVVLGPDVARTETGQGVGSTGAELRKALGIEVDRGDIAYDRRVFEFAKLPGVSFVTHTAVDLPIEKTRVIAVVLGWGDRQGPTPGESPPLAQDRRLARATCRAGAALAEARSELLATARGRTSPRPSEGAHPRPPVIRFGCFTTPSPEAVVALPGELAIVSGDRGKLRRLGAFAVAAVDFATVIDLDDDGRDEIIVGTQVGSILERAVELTVLRWEGGRLVALATARPFAISAAEAAAVGVTPVDIDLVLEFSRREGGLGIGGLYLARKGGQGASGPLVEVAPLVPTVLRVRARHGLPGTTAGAEGSGWDAGPVRGMMRRSDGGSSIPTNP